jgi:hypothetical protein
MNVIETDQFEQVKWIMLGNVSFANMVRLAMASIA